MLLDLVVEITNEVGIEFEFINMGGGIGTPYKPEDTPVSYALTQPGVILRYLGLSLRPHPSGPGA